MNVRKPVVILSVVTFALGVVPRIPPLLLPGLRSTIIKLTAHYRHPLHAVGSTASIFDSDSFVRFIPDNTEYALDAASDRIVVDVKFIAQQPTKLPPFMQS